jgi:processive 1,2-diacylglycerol beta-glucosyltransferase
VDLYLVPTIDVLREMKRRGIEESRIRVTGIPIHKKFLTPASAAQARQELGLRPEPFTVLVQGGSKGIGPLREIASKLLEIRDLQVIVACGSNRSLFREFLRRKNGKNAGRLKVLSFTRRMDLCLAAADLLIGKAGGVSLAEAMALGVPAILLSPLPGQEERNAEILVRHGAARLVRGLDELLRTVAKTLDETETLANLRRAARRIGRPRSSEIAQREIMSLLRSLLAVTPA